MKDNVILEVKNVENFSMEIKNCFRKTDLL